MHYAPHFKYLVLGAILLLQACLGATYSWSIFDTQFIEVWSISPSLASAPFNIFYVCFPLTLLIANRLISKFGTRFSAMLGAGLFGIGWILAGLGSHSIYITLLSIGVVGGVGVGLAYLIPIYVGVRWFPKSAGLVTGLAVGGFAMGAAVTSQVSKSLIAVDVSAFTVLSILGACYLVIGVFASSFMILPETVEDKQVAEVRSLSSLIRQPLFLALFVAMTAGLTSGFFINSKIMSFEGAQIDSLITVVSIFAIANAIGRIAWGALSDLTSNTRCIVINLSLQAVALILVNYFQSVTFGMVYFAAISGFNYGGVLVLFASEVRVKWGTEAITTVYPLLFLSNVFAALINVGSVYVYAHFSLVHVVLPVALFLITSTLYYLMMERKTEKIQRQSINIL